MAIVQFFRLPYHISSAKTQSVENICSRGHTVDKEKVSLAKIQDVPKGSVVMLSGPPGAGKSTFCQQVVLKSMAEDQPVIFVTSERSPSGTAELLRERGMGEFTPGSLSFVDAFTETVGLTCTPHEYTVCANCADLNSLSMATTRLQERVGQKGILLAFDSLTSPYLFCGTEVTRFIRLFLSKFAAEGNSVLALVDEGCGKEEDLGSMLSIADGIIRMEVKENSRVINLVKHPKARPVKIEVSAGSAEPDRIGVKFLFDNNLFNSSKMRQFVQSSFFGSKTPLRKEVGDFVNLFWPNLAQWSGMLWDPKRFPRMKYELNKEDGSSMRQMMQFFPWHLRLGMKLLPEDLSQVKDMKKILSRFTASGRLERSGIPEYLEDISSPDEHYFRVYESSDCWAFAGTGAAMAAYHPSNTAGLCEAIEKNRREWNAIETKCIGLGDPYCEFKLVPGQINELKDSLEAVDSTIMGKIHDRLINQLMGFLLNNKPLVDRPTLGSEIHLHAVGHAFSFPYLAGERYQMALRMGGSRVGREVGEHLIGAGLDRDEAIMRVINFLTYCKVGKITAGKTIKIEDNCESYFMKFNMLKPKEACCFFMTGFLNGLFSAVKNQRVREVKCIALGDPYCEWEII
jgi:KaiC/GvpD/RAD55 family RecA-like ATPase/predicted hydrocarbon binding protein